jgi:hypothetical protein
VAAEVRLTVISMSARSPDGDDAAYLQWHGLDHMPEQYGIPAVVHAQRWVSTPSCRAARSEGSAALAPTDHVVQYLFAGAAGPALDRFFALGAELNQAGRMPLRLPPVELGAYTLAATFASPKALVDADVLPWRPCRGAYLLVTENLIDAHALCTIPGVAGVWRYEGGQFHERLADTSKRHLAVCYLDDDPIDVGARITGTLTHPALLGAPFMSVVPFDWNRSLP